jgi:hypothetical protein
MKNDLHMLRSESSIEEEDLDYLLDNLRDKNIDISEVIEKLKKEYEIK